jgi:phosphatidylserine/phosphatidylglycerophosphate/cardiolipin synthase-like enzyme
VRIVVESNYLRESSPIPIPASNEKEAPGEFEQNREQMRTMLRSAAHFKLDFNASTFHHKFIVRDYNKPKAALLTGSTNFTPTGTGSNLNNVVIFKHSDIIKAYRKEWNQINEGTFGRLSPKGYKAQECKIGDTKVYPLFAPDHNPELVIVNAILQAKQSVHFAIFTFSGSSTIDDALLSALGNGISVKGILDRTQSAHDYSPHPALINAGADLRRHDIPILPGFEKRGKLHHKIMVIDGKVAISGSFNYTDKANRFNDENVFFIHNEKVAEYFIDEIERIYDNLADNF